MVELTAGQFAAARARGEARVRGPRAEQAHDDAGRDRVIVRLTTGVEIGFASRDAESLQHASRDKLATIEVQAHGLGIRFPELDADFDVPALLEGVLGSESWMAALRARALASLADPSPTLSEKEADTHFEARFGAAGAPRD
jgi:hypothetical protein